MQSLMKKPSCTLLSSTSHPEANCSTSGQIFCEFEVVLLVQHLKGLGFNLWTMVLKESLERDLEEQGYR
eukprot:587269-Amphidinium_carterae.1